MLGNVWAQIQNYFRDWLKETGGIGAYTTFNIDLSKAHTDERYTFSGDQVIVTGCDNPVSIKLNDVRNDRVDLDVIKQINSPFNEFYITNAASSGSLKILCGSEGVFQCDPSLRIMSGKYGAQFKPVAVDSSGNIISVVKGLEGANLRTIAVDADGNIIGVFKGDYGGALKTLKTDSEGRLLAIITDPEDVYGSSHQMGNAELAARLGSLTSWDRMGNLLWFEDWENNIITWSESKSGAGNIAIGTTERYTGNYSLELTAAAGVGQHATVNRGVELPPDGKLGMEIAFQPSIRDSYLILEFDIDNLTNRYVGKIRYDTSDGSVDYWNSGGSWTSLAGTKRISPQFHSFTHFKLVIDNDSGNYVRAKLGSKEWDMTGISMESKATGTYQLCLLEIRCENNNVANTAVMYVDNVIYTVNEA